MQNSFYNSKTNTILLLILIILMLIALYVMSKEPEKYNNLSKQKNQKISLKNEIINRKIEGNVDDLIYFSIKPNSDIMGLVNYGGIIKGGYFFEANILINVLDEGKNILKTGNATAKSEWMTKKPVYFEGKLDLNNIKKGLAYIEIKNDNPGAPDEGIIKNILIPIIIK